MARLEAQSKLLYYPTPDSVVELIASWFSAPEAARLVDPCCGKGEALAQFANLTNPESETWGLKSATPGRSKLNNFCAPSWPPLFMNCVLRQVVQRQRLTGFQ